MIQPLPLAKTKKEWFYIIFFLLLVFTLNTYYIYTQYSKFKQEELFTSKSLIVNIYKKDKFNVLKLQDDNFTFFTSTDQHNFKKLDLINITILSQDISYISYLKGFYAKSFNLSQVHNQDDTNQKNISNFINKQHSNNQISQIFNALFLAIPMNKSLQEKMSSFGISHLIAISGFHLGVLSFVFYWLIYFVYSYFHKNYFSYRNIKYDISLIVSAILFSYLYFLGNVPSLLRSFVMFIFALYFLRTNIKIFSFTTLLLVLLFIVALFPKLLFSLALWFSIAGVFYIYLFLQYFRKLNNIFVFFFFNIWLFLAMNPISHYFFLNTSLEQLYSPLFTILFTIFYPLELFFHLISYGYIFDSYITMFLNIEFKSIDILIDKIYFIIYIILSLLSIRYKSIFIIFNISFVIFNLYLYAQVY